MKIADMRATEKLMSPTGGPTETADGCNRKNSMGAVETADGRCRDNWEVLLHKPLLGATKTPHGCYKKCWWIATEMYDEI